MLTHQKDCRSSIGLHHSSETRIGPSNQAAWQYVTVSSPKQRCSCLMVKTPINARLYWLLKLLMVTVFFSVFSSSVIELICKCWLIENDAKTVVC